MVVWNNLGYAKKVVTFLGRQILKLGFFWVLSMNLRRTSPSLKYLSRAPGAVGLSSSYTDHY